jgi:outer membrane protein assembly factor BamB
MTACLRALAVVGMIACAPVTAPLAQGQNWPSFRGRFAAGVADGYATPVTWSIEKGERLKWRTPIPGLAHSSPIVWGDRVFVTTAVSDRDEPTLKVGMYGDVEPVEEAEVFAWEVYCLDKRSGAVLWEQTAHTGVPKIKRHPKSSHANSTPATDGEHVVAFFGSEGLYCYDMTGKLLWQKDLGLLDSGFFRAPAAQWGFGSSPVIHEGRLIVQCDVQRDSFLAALDVNTGRETWRTPREDVPTWSTPTVTVREGKSQVIVNGFRHAGGYDFETGKEVWRLTGGGDIPVPTPIVAHDLVFLTNAHGRLSPLYAIRAEAGGDVSLAEGTASNAGVAWSYPRQGCYMPTPLAYGDYLYCCRDNGTLACYRAKTGEQVYEERLKGGFSASPVAADGKLYLTSESGDVHVVKAGPEFQLLAANSMGETCMATPAVSHGRLFFRTRRNVVAVAGD